MAKTYTAAKINNSISNKYILLKTNGSYKPPQLHVFSCNLQSQNNTVNSAYFGRSEFVIMHWNKSIEIAIGLSTCMLVQLALRASNHCSPEGNHPTHRPCYV